MWNSTRHGSNCGWGFMQLNDEWADVSELLASDAYAVTASFLHKSEEVHVIHAVLPTQRGHSRWLDEFRMYSLVVVEQHIIAHIYRSRLSSCSMAMGLSGRSIDCHASKV